MLPIAGINLSHVAFLPTNVLRNGVTKVLIRTSCRQPGENSNPETEGTYGQMFFISDD